MSQLKVEPGTNVSARGRVVQRSFDFQAPSSTTPVKPQRIGQNTYQDNSAMTVWDDQGNEIFGDSDFMISGGRDRHFLHLLENADESPFIS